MEGDEGDEGEEVEKGAAATAYRDGCQGTDFQNVVRLSYPDAGLILHYISTCPYRRRYQWSIV